MSGKKKPSDVAAIVAMRQAGSTWAEIAAETGLSAATVKRRYVDAQGSPEGHPSPAFAGKPVEEPTLEELFDLARKSQAVIDRLDPVITHETIRIDASLPVGVIFVSCAHLGSRYTFYPDFERIFREVLDIDRLYWLSLGDDVEGFLPGFRDGSAIVDQAIANPKAQRRMLAGVLDRLAEHGKLLAGCASQHGGDWVRKATGDDPIKEMYMARSVPYFDGKGLISLQVGGQTYQIALAHEFPGHSMWNKNHAQRRAAVFDFPSADVVVQGDKHVYSVQESSLPPFEFDAGLRASYTQWLVQVGTAKTGNDKYSIRGWARGVLEWPVLVFRPDRHFVAHARDLALVRGMLAGW